MNTLKIFSLLCLLVLTLQFNYNRTKYNATVIQEKAPEKNLTDKISDYFTEKNFIGSVVEKWSNFTNLITGLFRHKHPKTGIQEDLQKHMNNFNKKISDFLKKNFPGENYTMILETFSDKFSGLIEKAKLSNDTLEAFTNKFYDFQENIVEFLTSGMHIGSKYDEKSVSQRIINFIERTEEYFGSKFTRFADYMKNYAEKSLHKKKQEGTLTYIAHYIERYILPSDSHKYSTCDEMQFDKCGHLCSEQNKVLCGCYIMKEPKKQGDIDCVCADSQPMCFVKHTHTYTTKEPKKDI